MGHLNQLVYVPLLVEIKEILNRLTLNLPLLVLPQNFPNIVKHLYGWLNIIYHYWLLAWPISYFKLENGWMNTHQTMPAGPPVPR